MLLFTVFLDRYMSAQKFETQLLVGALYVRLPISAANTAGRIKVKKYLT